MWQRSACLIQHLAPLVPQIGIEESNKLDHQDDCVFFLLPNSKSQTLRRLLYLLGLLFVNNNMNMLCRCYADAEAIFFWWNLVSTPEHLHHCSKTPNASSMEIHCFLWMSLLAASVALEIVRRSSLFMSKANARTVLRLICTVVPRVAGDTTKTQDIYVTSLL